MEFLLIKVDAQACIFPTMCSGSCEPLEQDDAMLVQPIKPENRATSNCGHIDVGPFSYDLPDIPPCRGSSKGTIAEHLGQTSKRV
jgi:hypothetical protein